MSKKQVTARISEEQYNVLVQIAKKRRWSLQVLLEVMIEKLVQQEVRAQAGEK